jgi:hypothetical protein
LLAIEAATAGGTAFNGAEIVLIADVVLIVVVISDASSCALKVVSTSVG